MIKRLGVLVAAAMILGRPALAADLSFPKFHSDITVKTDASIAVTETITADFGAPLHGIFRTIPYRFATQRGGEAAIPIAVTSVTQDSQPAKYTLSNDGTNVTAKIGDPNVTITGRHTYVLRYTAQAAVNFFSDHDELYWNVTGTDWDAPVTNITSTIRLPSTFSADRIRTACYTGPPGSTAQNCRRTHTASQADFGSQEFLTIVVGWPTGAVTKPSDYDQLRAVGTVSSVDRLVRHPAVSVGLNLILPVLVVGWLFRRWLTHGRDPKGGGTIIAQYDPPAGLTPGEMGTLVDERANQRDVVATIVDLAVRGLLTITELPEEKVLGLGKGKDYRLDRIVKANAGPLKDHEKKLLDGLFADGDSVKFSKLKGSFYDDVKAIQSDLYRQVRDQGHFVGNPSAIRSAYVVVGLIIAFGGFFAFGWGIVGPFIAGLAVAAAGPFMPKRTDKGAAALWHAKGFKLFLAKAEKYRLQWQEKEHIFEQYLPYAMAFGVAEKWSKAFAGIEQTPSSWYRGAGGVNVNSLVLWSALNGFAGSTIRSFASPAASGSSGFGGGGFSGGGGGGGGGGGW